MRSLHCGGYPQGTSRLELQAWFSQYGNIECLHTYRSSHAFICFENEENGEAAIRALHNMKFEHDSKLTVEWAKRECNRRHDETPSELAPTKTLFVFNFDPQSDLKQYFGFYGTVLKVDICDDVAFVEFKHQEDATRAFEAAHMSMLGTKVLKVDYKSPCISVPPTLQRERVVPRPLHRSPDYNTYRARRSRSPGSWPLHRSPHYSGYDSHRPQRSRTPGSWPLHLSPHYSRYDSYRAQRSRSPGSWPLHRSPYYSGYDSYRPRRSRTPGSWPLHLSPNYSRYDSSRAQRSPDRYYGHSYSSGRRWIDHNRYPI